MAKAPDRNELAVKGSANDQPAILRVLQLADEQPYGSVQEEREAKRIIRQAVQESVQAYDMINITRATGEAKRLTEQADEAESVAEQLRDITKAARRGEEIDLQAWSALDAQAQRLTELALSQPERMADLLEMLDALNTLQLKYPSLPRNLKASL
jgi:hypothetical protein